MRGLLDDKSVALFDIEGTTTSIQFVHDVLFPYAARELPDFIAKNWGESTLKADLEALSILADQEPDLAAATRHKRDRDNSGHASQSPAHPPECQRIIDTALALIDADRKVTALKSLQGKIWRAGYQDQTLKADLYPDVLDALVALKDRGVKLYVYSSGSVGAQKLLFGHTEHGDLTHLFSGYFDTNVGHKREVSSYAAIAKETGVPEVRHVFFTDVVQEADAARTAGMHTCIMLRPENPPQPEHTHPTLVDFSSLI